MQGDHRPVQLCNNSATKWRSGATSAPLTVTLRAVNEIQPITYNGRLVALVAGDSAMIVDSIREYDRTTVKAMCLYALEIAAGDRPGPYSDREALIYARQAAAQRN
jgi:hypothetical protein